MAAAPPGANRRLGTLLVLRGFVGYFVDHARENTWLLYSPTGGCRKDTVSLIAVVYRSPRRWLIAGHDGAQLRLADVGKMGRSWRASAEHLCRLERDTVAPLARRGGVTTVQVASHGCQRCHRIGPTAPRAQTRRPSQRLSGIRLPTALADFVVHLTA